METVRRIEDATAVETAEAPGVEEFRERWLLPGKPVLINGATAEWPAMRWTPDFFRSIGRGVKVKIEYGNTLQGPASFGYWDMAGYIDALEELGSRGGRVPYLIYLDLFGLFPKLRKDARFPLWKGRLQEVRGWIGPPGTYTGLHYDIADNLFAQFFGAKEFTLYPPEQSHCLYPGKRYEFGSVLSEVDGRNPDYRRHPLFRRAQGIKVRVAAGQILFTPKHWWHEVVGLETSISASSFGFRPREMVTVAIPAFAREALHLIGLYRKGNCTCHLSEPPP